MLKTHCDISNQEISRKNVSEVKILSSAIICLVTSARRTSNTLLLWAKEKKEAYDLFETPPLLGVAAEAGKVKCLEVVEVTCEDESAQSTRLFYIALIVDQILELIVVSDRYVVIDHKKSIQSDGPYLVSLNSTCSTAAVACKDSLHFISTSSLAVISRIPMHKVLAVLSIVSHDRYICLTEQSLVGICAISYSILFELSMGHVEQGSQLHLLQENTQVIRIRIAMTNMRLVYCAWSLSDASQACTTETDLLPHVRSFYSGRPIREQYTLLHSATLMQHNRPLMLLVTHEDIIWFDMKDQSVVSLIPIKEELGVATPLLSAASDVSHPVSVCLLSGFDRVPLVRFLSPPVTISAMENVSAASDGISSPPQEVRRAPPGLPKWAQHPSEKIADNNPPVSTTAPLAMPTAAATISLIQTAATIIPATSPLYSNLSAPLTLPRHQSTATHKLSASHKHSWEAPAKSKTGGLMNKPVTFHNRIKSSGYGAVKRSTSAPAAAPNRIRMYPSNCTGSLTLQNQNRFPERGSEGCPFLGITYNTDGTQIGLRSSNATAVTLRTPIAKYHGDGYNYTGHNNIITSIDFNFHNTALLTTSDDGRACVWKFGKVDSQVLTISHLLRNPTTATSGKSESKNKPLSNVAHGRFYYMDKFILVSEKESVMMYTYNLDNAEAKNDLKRLYTEGVYKLAHRWSHEAQTITALTALNSTLSNVVLSATSDRSLHITDIAAETIAHTFRNTHDRPIHYIALPQPSIHVSHSPLQYNNFVSMATDGAAKIWDIRTTSPVGSFNNHVNRRENINCAYSPCMKYVAMASEDKSVRIIDLRTFTEQSKVSGIFRDVVSGVAYHPIHPQLAACSLDGTVNFFADNSASGN